MKGMEEVSIMILNFLLPHSLFPSFFSSSPFSNRLGKCGGGVFSSSFFFFCPSDFLDPSATLWKSLYFIGISTLLYK